MGACEPIARILGEKFVKAFLALKETEYEAFFPRDQLVGNASICCCMSERAA